MRVCRGWRRGVSWTGAGGLGGIVVGKIMVVCFRSCETCFLMDLLDD